MNIDTAAKRFAGATEYFARKHGPAILTACGVAGIGVTMVLTGRAVLKAQEPVKELKLKIQQANEAAPEDRGAIKAELGRDFLHIARIFAPPVAAASVSAFCVIASHGLMKNKQLALAAAYTAVQNSYEAYRARVREEVGEEKELALYRDVKFLRPEGDSELPCEIDTDDRMPSPYVKFFDSSNPNFKKTPEYNHLFLNAQMQMANDRLRARGYLFLNEVYEALGFDWTQAGQIIGWKMGNGGDDFVSFGIYDIFDDNSRAFVNGVEPVIMLDFNVDGPITI